MRTYKPEPVDKGPEKGFTVPSVHPKVRARVLAAIPAGSECSLNDLRAYTGYEGPTVLRAITALELAGEIVGIYRPLPARWKRANAAEGRR